MAPFRALGRSNRSGRLAAENDIFEGLPVRQYRRTEGTFGVSAPEETETTIDSPWPELPMPRDAPLLAPHTQALLREARRPKFRRPKPEHTEDDKGEDEDVAEKDSRSGWQAKKWTVTPKHLEEPERNYLAKRRKGLPSTYAVESAQIAAQVPTRKAKVRKLDAAGNSTIYEVIVPEGQPVEGEIIDEDVSMVEAPSLAPGTVIEGIGVANAEGQVVANNLLQPTPQRKRKPPPPPRRRGGPGRGRKKVMFQRPPAAEDEPQPDGVYKVVNAADSTQNGDAAKQTSQQASGANAEGEDDEGEEGDEGEGDGDGDGDGEGDGDGDEGDEEEEGEITELDTTAPVSEAPVPALALPVDSAAPSDVPMSDVDSVQASLPVLEAENGTSSGNVVNPPPPRAEDGLITPDLPLAQTLNSAEATISEALPTTTMEPPTTTEAFPVVGEPAKAEIANEPVEEEVEEEYVPPAAAEKEEEEYVPPGATTEKEEEEYVPPAATEDIEPTATEQKPAEATDVGGDIFSSLEKAME